MLLEVVASIGLLVIVLTLLTTAFTQYTRNGDVLAARQRAVLAAEAVLNEVRAGQSPSDADVAARFGEIDVDVERAPGEGDWSGMTLVRVTVRLTARGDTPVTARLAGYVAEEQP